MLVVMEYNFAARLFCMHFYKGGRLTNGRVCFSIDILTILLWNHVKMF